MPRSHIEVEILLRKLEQSLRDAKMWSYSTPPDEDLESKLPFSVDMLSFEQWLQFIFIPKMSELLNSKSILPENVNLLPMAEQGLSTSKNRSGVIEVIKQIDLVFSDQ
ncbi:MAG: YqcC family protein [Paraglaciecola sp.]|uniref:YqcC family protein n=1 Tax=Paraglaciecola sp. TaxID=1920173 RepID=UPI00329971C3